jgi:hypothetical protein
MVGKRGVEMFRRVLHILAFHATCPRLVSMCIASPSFMSLSFGATVPGLRDSARGCLWNSRPSR